MSAKHLLADFEDSDLELRIQINSAILMCDETNDAHLMARYLLEQALMALAETSPGEDANLKH